MNFLKTKTQVHYFDYLDTNKFVTTKKAYTSKYLMIFITYKMNIHVTMLFDFLIY